VDWEANDMQVRTDLLQAAIHWGNFVDLRTWSATLPQETKTLLQNTGFNSVDETVSMPGSYSTVLVRPVHDEMLMADWVFAGRRLLDLANWKLRMIYSDAY
jgi:hypothetical protein